MLRVRALALLAILLFALPAVARADSGAFACKYTGPPQVWTLTYPGVRGKVKLCQGEVFCVHKGKPYKILSTLCLLEGGECPTATACGRYDPGFRVRDSKRRAVPE